MEYLRNTERNFVLCNKRDRRLVSNNLERKRNTKRELILLLDPRHFYSKKIINILPSFFNGRCPSIEKSLSNIDKYFTSFLRRESQTSWSLHHSDTSKIRR